MTITETVRKTLRQSGLTQQKIAARSGTTQRLVSSFLAGHNINSGKLDDICRAFKIRITTTKGKTK